MKRLGLVCGVLALLALSCPASFAEDEGGEEKPKPPNEQKAREGKAEGRRNKQPALRGHYGIMVRVLKLDDETQAKLREQLATNEKAHKEWTAANGQKLQELRKARAKAKKAKDKEKVQELDKQIAELRQAEAKLKDDANAKIMALLTDEQRAVWNGFLLRRAVSRRFKKAKLTEEQAGQVQKLCEEAAKTMPPAGAEDKETKKARKEAINKLCDDISEKVLTDEQRAKLTKGREARPEGRDEAKEKAKRKAKAERKERGAKKEADDKEEKSGEPAPETEE